MRSQVKVRKASGSLSDMCPQRRWAGWLRNFGEKLFELSPKAMEPRREALGGSSSQVQGSVLPHGLQELATLEQLFLKAAEQAPYGVPLEVEDSHEAEEDPFG